MSRKFTPTHELVLTSHAGTVESIDVMIAPSDVGGGGPTGTPAYTLAEWEAEVAADWEMAEDGTFSFQGQSCPSGTASVEVRRITRRTITLTDRAPVKIEERHWPEVAAATGDSWRGTDPGKYRQARDFGEVDTYAIRVRQHADGRVLVYATVNAAAAAWHQPARGESYRGGELVAAGSTIPLVIRRVGEAAGIPERVIRDCIANLPAEEI